MIVWLIINKVRHETAGLTTFYQPADNGAGAVSVFPYFVYNSKFEMYNGYNGDRSTCFPPTSELLVKMFPRSSPLFRENSAVETPAGNFPATIFYEFSWKFQQKKMTHCRAGSDVDAGKIIQEPKLAFLTGAWWIAQGSQKILAGPCHDLRPALDQVRSIFRTWWRSGSEERTGTGNPEPPDWLLPRLSLHFRRKRKSCHSTMIRIFQEISIENWNVL